MRYPYIPRECYPAVMFAAKMVREGTGRKAKATERLFVQERFADEYRERMESGTTASLFDTEED